MSKMSIKNKPVIIDPLLTPIIILFNLFSSYSPLGNSESENSLKSDQLCNINSLLMANAPVRRYKQYTEDTLQQVRKTYKLLILN